ncbi:unnamed protein product [Effrenium voratum]|nr:unnamed protein product [Effrenium voratum]|mmetsp:Transcript_119345/g.283315  ORF Transcript_119345/g.283315 Transcript_119345/m.283315 type:complete len:326 (+) Transcript_119345:75-1052(+)
MADVSSACEAAPSVAASLVQHHTIYEVIPAGVSGTGLGLLQAAKQRLGSGAFDAVILIVLCLILVGFLASAAVWLHKKEDEPVPTPTLSAADFVKFTAQRPQTRLPPRTSASSSGNEEAKPTGPKRAQEWRPTLTEAKDVKRRLVVSLRPPIIGEAQQTTWHVLEGGLNIFSLRADEYEEGGLLVESSRGVVASVRTQELHSSDWKPPEIFTQTGEVFAEIQEERLFGANMLLPDQIANLGRRFVAKDPQGRTLLRLSGTLEDRRMQIMDAMGYVACNVSQGEHPQEKIIDLEEHVDGVLILCMLFGAEKLRLVAQAARGEAIGN